MHEYLRAIGLSHFEDNSEVDNFIKENLDERYLISSFSHKNGNIIGQYRIPTSPSIFLSIIGEQNLEKQFKAEYYFPCIKGYDPLVITECSIQRHSEKETFAGIIDDNKLGMALIFYVINPNQYLSIMKERKKDDIRIFKIYLSALSLCGSVILPVEKCFDHTDEILYKRHNIKENIYSVVDTSLIPCGIECDKYQILGEILSVTQKVNAFTDEILYEMRISAMGYIFPLCINEKDLVGDPQPGRRFKGIIWLQGEIEFLDKKKQ